MKTKLMSVLTLIILGLGLVLSLGFLRADKMTAQAAAGEIMQTAQTDQKVSNWLLQAKYDDGTSYQPILTEVAAGATSGYGKFELNKRDVSLSTRANVGFQLVGWRVTYTTTIGEDGGTDPAQTKEITAFLHNRGNSQEITYNIPSENYAGEPVVLTMAYQDTDGDGYFDSGSFKISNIFSDMTVDAVFDYIYYSIEIENAFELINVADFSCNLYEDWGVYFESNEFDEARNRLVYHNAYLQRDGKLYYYGTIYSEQEFYYTTNLTGGEEQKIDIFRGNLRLGDDTSFEMVINIKSNFDESVNVDVYAVYLTQNDTKLQLGEGTVPNFAKIYKEEGQSRRTTKVEVGVRVVETKSKKQTISLEYHNLYLATINVKIDGKGSSTDRYIRDSINYILDTLTANYFYSRISNNKYLVKSALDNENQQTFELYCDPSIYGKEGENKYHLYYTFSNLYLSGNVGDHQINGNHVRYPNIIDDFEINVEYNSATYSVNFEPYLKIDERNIIKITEVDFPGFKVDEPIENLNRGSGMVLCENPAQNVGFKFYGYALSAEGFYQNDSLGVAIDYDRPENLTVLMIYEYAQFNLAFDGYDQISLTNDGKQIMPISALNLLINNGETINITRTELDAGTPQETGKKLTLRNSFNLNESLTLTATLNEGFDYEKFAFYIKGIDGEIAYSGDKTTFSFNITQEFLTKLFAEENLYADGTIIIEIKENFSRYNFSYFINPTLDKVLNRKIIMADISLETAEGSAAIMSTISFDDGEAEKPIQEINVSNLKLYETIKLVAKARTYVQNGVSYTYDFVRFTADNKTSLSNGEENGGYTYSAFINADNLRVMVVFTVQTSTITIATNKSAAFSTSDFNNHVIISQANAEVPIDVNNQVELSAGPLTVKFKNADEPFNFGFSFVSYALTTSRGAPVKTVDTTKLSSPYLVNDFVIQGRQTYILQLNFETIKFNLSVAQFGEIFVDVGQTKNFSGELLSFGESTTLTLSVEDGFVMRFDLPEGVFVDKFSFINQGNLIDVPKFASSSSKDFAVYSHEFSIADVQQYFINNGALSDYTYTLNIRIDYKMYRYDLTVNYEFLSSKGPVRDGKIVYPNLELTYSLNGDEISELIEVHDATSVFENVPYGVSPRVCLTSTLPVGYISIFDWSYSNTVSAATTGEDGGLPYIELIKLISNETLVYKIEYQAIKVKLGIEGSANMGSPTASKNSVELFDTLQINANPNKNLGYKFSYFFYFYNYTLGESGWEENKDNIYVFSGGKFERANENYDENKSYYLIKEYSESSVYIDEEIDFNDYAVIDDSIYFYVAYGYININIKNVSEDLPERGTSLRFANILPEDYADYFIYVQDSSGWVQLEEGGTVTIQDTVMVLIKIRTANVAPASGAGGQQEIDLARGLKVFSVSYGLKLNFDVEFEGESYDCSTQFNVNDVISNVDEEENLILTYDFVVDNKVVNVATNIESDSFYFENGITKFVIHYRAISGSAVAGDSRGRKSLNVQQQFLSAVQFSYGFENRDDSQHFKISSMTFMHNGVELSEQDYLAFGIEVQDNSSQFYIRFLDDLQVILHVEPILNFYNTSNYVANSIAQVEPDADGNYWLTKEFLCNRDASGRPQELSKGTSNANIVSDSMIINALKIDFYNDAGEKVDPIDVGVYQVVLSFVSDNANYAWLGEIELNYKIYLEVTKLPIIVSHKTDFEDHEDYWGGDQLDFSRIAGCLIIQDDFGGGHLYIEYSENSNIRFKNSAICYVTNTDEVGVQYRFRDAQSGLNLTIVGLELVNDDFGKNFELKFKQDALLRGDDAEQLIDNILVIEGKFTINKKMLTILGIQVYDKVYDGNTNVDYDIVNWQFGQGLIDADNGLIGIDFSNMIFAYENADVGNDKRVTINCENALVNTDEQNPRIQNYVLVVSDFFTKIYPYSVEAVNIAGLGNVTITNPRGLMNADDATKSYRQFVRLIPIGAQLKVDAIYLNSNEYREIYSTIAAFLSNRTEFAFGYNFELLAGDYHTEIDNNLYITLPGVGRLSKVLWQAGDQTDELTYLVEGDMITVDLSQISAAIKSILFLRDKDYLAWWQIGLIIFLIVIVLLIIVLIFIHERRKKKLKDMMNEKI